MGSFLGGVIEVDWRSGCVIRVAVRAFSLWEVVGVRWDESSRVARILAVVRVRWDESCGVARILAFGDEASGVGRI